jgi:DNA-binding transcriptional MerR regulator
MTGKTYRIGEAAAKLNLKTYVLRFWEMEFSEIAPIRTEKGQRLYREADLALLARIKYWLHERGLTIEGARRLLREEVNRGITYTAAEAAFPGLADEMAYPETDDEPENEDSADDSPALASSLGAPSAVPRSAPPGIAQGQASLFPAEPSFTELSHLVAELKAIRDILTF